MSIFTSLNQLSPIMRFIASMQMISITLKPFYMRRQKRNCIKKGLCTEEDTI